MTSDSQETERLLDRAARNDRSAVCRLLDKHRQRLRCLVATHLDRRLSARIDPSDIVQEALVDASRKLPAYVRDRPMPYYPWVRRLALEKLLWWRRFHVHTSKRDIARENPLNSPGHSTITLVDRLIDTGTSPSNHAIRVEERSRAHNALASLSPADRRVLELRYFEGLPFAEIAAVLEIGLSAVKMRHLRALERFQEMLVRPDEESAR